ncbi:patatin family protein [Photobacterium sanctipauli]|uniref:Patatin family protein n=1 Tax=Photobacterium sanctipauli TaxID=1342794 RepID=A0A2T3NYI9_9GAMM|nr:patatin family protein [Photobacterium sanctipauli]PSW21278.1 patatin family protein [Photobacterium sanctipauli]
MTGKHISYAVQNVEGLSYSPGGVSKVALVTEGGGQRGIFTAGVLDAFLEHGFNPFSLLIGTSSGALNLASFICGQHHHAYRVITEATTTAKFFDIYRYLSRRGGLDLDWLIEQTKTELLLDWQRGCQNMRHRTVLATASNMAFHQASYFDLASDDRTLSLKASCSIPGLSHQHVVANEEQWVDGGLCAPIPVQEAYNRGYRHIVVVRTVPIEQRFDHCWMTNIQRMLGKTKAASMIALLLEHEKNYRQTQEFLNNPPDDATIYEIHPRKPLSSKLIGSDIEALDTDYQKGHRSGRYFLNTIGRHLNNECVQDSNQYQPYAQGGGE